ncbi:MAG: signal recognition particle-docking protein FtsY [Ignavibacteriaceae bacterium]
MGILNNIGLDKLKKGLSKTRKKFVDAINETITGKAIIDDETIEKIEEILITSDIGFEVTENIVENVKRSLKADYDRSEFNIIKSVKEELVKSINKNGYSGLKENHSETKAKPIVILIVGVNGVGKTTTIGKLAYNFKKDGLKVIVGAADTFRAAAGEQLDIWAERAGADIIQKASGSDPSSVAYEAVNDAIKNYYDVVLIDTAGRLHNKANLMNELGKIKRAIAKVLPDAPQETYLVLDGTVGQNAIVQADEFSKVTELTGLVITKLDGTAKGGVIFQICDKFKTPVRYIGIGEGIDDFQEFDPENFVNALFDVAEVK